MDKEKFVQRIESMLYQICGCDCKDAEIVLKECLKRNREKNKDLKHRLREFN